MFVSVMIRFTNLYSLFDLFGTLFYLWASLVAQMVKNLPAMQETRVQSLDQEGPLEKEVAPHSSVLAWRIPWTEEPGGPQSMVLQRVGLDWATNTLALQPLSNAGVKNRAWYDSPAWRGNICSRSGRILQGWEWQSGFNFKLGIPFKTGGR